MNNLSRNITGPLAILLGAYLMTISLSEPWILIYGLPIFIVGFFILFNKKEDVIEKIKTKVRKVKK
tara:strand:+ start:968 stop:1165 length:198 start_codon:yes stop_codon:yes gene_type:complete